MPQFIRDISRFQLTMYICICNATTETDLKQLIKDNPNLSLDDLREMDIANNCSRCLNEVNIILCEDNTKCQNT